MNKLPDSTARALTSSQIITSVFSAVKELAENSFDAGSSSVEVHLDNYGLDRIEVRDNGHGIDPSDAELVAQRFYTSKLKELSDLASLTTYGFRGEALAAICAMSDVTVTSSTDKAETATTVVYDSSGTVVASRPSPHRRGTSVVVSRLFKNLPVRKQLYSSAKKKADELLKVRDLLMAYSITLPRLRLELRHNRSVVWQKSGVADHKEALAVVFGSEVSCLMVPVEFQREDLGLEVRGLLPGEEALRNVKVMTSNPAHCVVSVNKRPVEFKALKKLLSQIAVGLDEGKGPSYRYPIGIICLSLTIPGSVDVNVEPNKTRVLIRRHDEVVAAIKQELLKVYKAKQPPAPRRTDCHVVSVDSQVDADDADALDDETFLSLEIPVDEREIVTVDSAPSATMQWSMGKSVRDKHRGVPVEPVRVLTEQPREKTKPSANRREEDVIVPQPKRVKLAEIQKRNPVFKSPVRSQTAVGKIQQRPSKTPSLYSLLQKRMDQSKPKTKRLLFSLERLQRRSTEQLNESCGLKEPVDVIGWLEENGLCIMKHQQKLLCFDSVRANEAILFQRLADTFSLSHEPLDAPHDLEAEQLGHDLWQRLLALEWADNSWDGSRECVDPLLSANGFLVKQIGSPEARDLQLVEVNAKFPHYGLSELSETLENIVKFECSNGGCLCPLSYSRPMRARTYLRSEAARLARSSCGAMPNTDVVQLFLRLMEDGEDVVSSFCCSLVEFQNDSFYSISQS